MMICKLNKKHYIKHITGVCVLIKRILFLLVYCIFTFPAMALQVDDESSDSSSAKKVSAFLDCELIKFETFRGVYKDYRNPNDQNNGRSALYGVYYPKMTMVHPYTQQEGGVSVPFTATIPREFVNPPLSIAKRMPSDASHPSRIFSIVVQALDEIETQFALKPHYVRFPDASTTVLSEDVKMRSQNGKVQWAVVPGQLGNISPVKPCGENELLEDTISIHRWGPQMVPMRSIEKFGDELKKKNPKLYAKIQAKVESGAVVVSKEGTVDMDDVNDVPLAQRIATIAQTKGIIPDKNGKVNKHIIDGMPELDDWMILSPNNMLLSGLNKQKSSDGYDLVIYGSTVAATYRWMLNAVDMEFFQRVLETANTFRELLVGLTGEISFAPLLSELDMFIGRQERPKPKVVDTEVELFHEPQSIVPKGITSEGFVFEATENGFLLQAPAQGAGRFWFHKDESGDKSLEGHKCQPWVVKKGQTITIELEIEDFNGTMLELAFVQDIYKQIGVMKITKNGKYTLKYKATDDMGVTPDLVSKVQPLSLKVKNVRVTIH